MVDKIINYYQYNDKLAAGGQPTEEQLHLLKKENFEVIVSISPVSTKNYLKEEAELTEKLDIHFIHFPIDCGNLQELHYLAFKGIMDSVRSKKTFVHCGGNIKTSNLIHMYNVLEKGINEAESLKELKKIQEPEEKWFTYFKKMGMLGLS